MGAGAQVGSSLSSMGGLMANPATRIAAGMLASAKFYDAGYRLDTEDVARQKVNKMSFAIDPALSSVLNLGVKTTELATKLLGGGKLANILTGGSLIAGSRVPLIKHCSAAPGRQRITVLACPLLMVSSAPGSSSIARRRRAVFFEQEENHLA